MTETPAAPALSEGFWESRGARSIAGQVMVGALGVVVVAALAGGGAGWALSHYAPIPEPWGAIAGFVVAGGFTVFGAMFAFAMSLRAHVTAPLRDGVAEMVTLMGDQGVVRLQSAEGDEAALVKVAVREVRDEVDRSRHELANQRRILQRGVERETELLARRNLELGRSKRDAESAVKDLQRAQSQLVQQERMATLGQLLAGIAHEINNPVNYMVNAIRPLQQNVQRIGGQFERLQAGEPPIAGERGVPELMADIEASVGLIKAGADRTATIVQNLRTFSRNSGEEIAPFDLREGIDLTIELLNPIIKDRVEIIRDYVDIRAVECSQGEINQVFMNILSNACQAIDGEGAVRITIREIDLGVVVNIEDSGCGISEQAIERIFDPFFTTKDVGKGTGLGLSISYNIIQAHGGTIDVESKVGVGSKFRLWLPTRRPK